jgi:subtilisin family serine protease
MRGLMSWKTSLLLTLLVLGVTGFEPTPGIAQPRQIAGHVTLRYPLTGVTLNATKIVDPTTGEGYLEAADTQGRPADPAAAAAAEEEARAATFGKIDARLHAKLPAHRDEGIPVSIWLNVPDPPVSREPAATTTAAEAAQARLTDHLDAVQGHMAAQRRGVLNALTRMGVQAHEPLYAPAVFANLNRGQIQALSHHPDVSTIYGPEEYGRFQGDAATTERAYRVWAAGNLGAGLSSRPVVHEDDGVADFNPFLNNLTHPVIFWCSTPSGSCSVGKNIDDHASEVAGIIAATHPMFRGIAPSSQLIFSANFQSFDNPGFDARAVDAFEWARGNGGDPTNMSWGTFCGGFQTFMSRYVDWATRNLFATFVISAGNTGFATECGGTTNDEKVSAPGLAWSAITVGSQFDNNSGFWSGDGMSAFSRWRNPDFATGMEKPEVVAVGADVRTTDAAGGDHLTASGVSGTSFSAPQVAGQVALLLSRQPGQNQWPKTNKAAVLASAYHDIEAGTTRDGVGSVVMNNSDDTYRLNRFINDSAAGSPLVASDFPRNWLDVLSLTAGQRVRVAIAWDSHSTGGGGTDVLGADIDLRVRHPDNSTIVCSSTSIENAWEMCEFTVPVTGTYDILMRGGRAPSWVSPGRSAPCPISARVSSVSRAPAARFPSTPPTVEPTSTRMPAGASTSLDESGCSGSCSPPRRTSP